LLLLLLLVVVVVSKDEDPNVVVDAVHDVVGATIISISFL